MTLISIVVPVFNEESMISLFLERLGPVLASITPEYVAELVFVNDGSVDGTLPALLHAQREDERIRVLDLSRNFGKEAALSAGLDAARGVAIIPMDVDLQDPPELLTQMLAKWREGAEVVLCRRVDRDQDDWFKRTSARGFYRLHNLIAHPKIPENAGDFRLMDRCVVDALKALPESRRFMKGLFAWAGFKAECVDYARPQRPAGNSKFNAWRLWNLALEGLTSFSTAPLRVWTYLGLIVSFGAFLYALIIVLKVLIQGVDVPGYASLMVSVMFLGGLQLIGIGILGEYLGRTYIESKRRPVYLVRRVHERNVAALASATSTADSSTAGEAEWAHPAGSTETTRQ